MIIDPTVKKCIYELSDAVNDRIAKKI